MIVRFFLFFLLSFKAGAQDAIIADFNTSEGNFSVALDFVNAPLTVANFIHLAGKGDDVLETRDGVPQLGDLTHFRHAYSSVFGAETPRLPLNVFFIPETDTTRAYFSIRQSTVEIGAVEATIGNGGFHEDMTGQDRIRLQLVSSDPIRYRITLRYPRNWLDARTLTVRDTPMYRELPINRVETGRRFHAGSFVDPFFEHPGYNFQDEVLITPGNTVNPFGAPFNGAWVLAMDTQAPNQNGSRFFITTAADPSLNGRFTAFGQVTLDAGRLVVSAIANTATNTEQVPNRAMTIHDITIRRSGLGAAAFFEGFHQTFLPGVVAPTPLRIERINGRFMLVTPLNPSTQTVLYSGTDLESFEGGFIDAQSPAALEDGLLDLSGQVAVIPKLFVKGFATEIGVWPSAEFDLANSQFTFNVTSGTDSGVLNFFLDSTGTIGSYTIDMEIVQTLANEDPVLVVSRGSGTFAVSYDFGQGPYKGVLSFTNVQGPLNVEEITLHIDSTRFANTPGIPEGLLIRRFDARTTDPEVDFLSYSGIYQKLK